MSFLTYLDEANDNKHLNKAKKTKDDEFYTSYDHAEQMIKPFAKHFSGKIILCNCDDPYKSEVFDYMRDNFKTFNMKELIGVGYRSKMQIVTNDNIEDIEVKNEGDFRKGESLEALKKCDIVVSNPPFSNNMFVDFIKLTMDNNKGLLAIGPLDGAKVNNIKPYIINGKLFVIKSPYESFVRPNDPASKATTVKVAVYTTFKEDPFGSECKLDNNVDILSLPMDSTYMVPVSISSENKFSIKEIPVFNGGDINKIIVPLHILRCNWRKHFRILDIMNKVKVNGKILMSGILMEYI